MYGGTKSELERLVADAEKLTGQALDPSKFSDIITAIHAVQENLGITGTTAKEASTTIEGSVNSMKAAWSNLMTGIADDNANLSVLIDNFVETASTAAANILPRITQILTGMSTAIQQIAPILAQQLPVLIGSILPAMTTAGAQLLAALIAGLVAALPQLLTAIPQILATVYNGFVSAAPQMAEAGGQLLQMLLDGLRNGIPNIASAALDIIDGFYSYLMDNVSTILDTGVEIINALAEGILSAIPELLSQLPEVIATCVEYIASALPEFVQSGIEILLSLVSGIIDTIPDLVSRIPEIITAFTSTVASNLPQILQSGVELLIQFADGILSEIPNLVGKLPEIINAIISGIGALMDGIINVGKSIIEGLWKGIGDAKDWLIEKIQNLCTDALGAIKDFFGIHSPSRVMRDQVGRMLAMGMALGIEDGEAAVLASITLLSERAFEIASDEARDFKELGEMYIDNLTYGIEAGRDAAISRMEQWIDDDYTVFEKKLESETDAIIKAKQAQIKKVGDTQKEALRAEIAQIKKDTDAKKTAYKEAGKEVVSTYKTALTTGYDEALDAVKKKMTAITQEAQKQRDAVLEDQRVMQEKLSEFGNLFTISDSGNLTLNSIEKNIKAVERYDAALTALSERGVSNEFMSKVTSLGVEEATKFAEKLSKLPDSAFAEYTAAWQKQQDLAKAVAEKFYADQLQTINDDFTAKIESALEDVPKMMDNIGKDSIQGMIDGMYSKSGALSAAASEIVRRAIAAMQAASKINSPSRETRDKIGVPLAQGVGVGFEKAYPGVMERMRTAFDASMAQTSARLQSAAGGRSSSVTREVNNNTTTVDRILRIEVTGEDGEFVRWLRNKIKTEDNRVGTALA